ncbi:hypothetical protein V6N12_037823 [Hibiscus sabdariffa]|uniref:Uncharacterized protein n=1 Tax=Hibiscus sabdariffa TaxID=183260 RepID=A0ABR2B1F0_9ROSI
MRMQRCRESSIPSTRRRFNPDPLEIKSLKCAGSNDELKFTTKIVICHQHGGSRRFSYAFSSIKYWRELFLCISREKMEILVGKFGLVVDFITGETCFPLLFRRKCSGFFDFSCHKQYICMSWIVLFGLLLAIFPTGKTIRPSFLSRQSRKNARTHVFYINRDFLIPFTIGGKIILCLMMKDQRTLDETGIVLALANPTFMPKEHTKTKHHKHEQRHNHSERDTGYYHYYLHHINKDKHRHRRVKSSSFMQQVHYDRRKYDDVGHRKHERATKSIERPLKIR